MILGNFLDTYPEVAQFGEEQLFSISLEFVRNWLANQLNEEVLSVAIVLTTRDVVPWELRLKAGHLPADKISLSNLSNEQFRKELKIPQNDTLDSPLPAGTYLFGVPLGRYVQGYRGHLFSFTSRSIAPKELPCLREAAAFLELVLTGEMVRLLSKQRIGQFRHTVLGPVQGLVSTSRQIVQLARSGELDREQLEKLSATVIAEGEALRLAMESQKLLAEGRVSLRLRPIPLRPFFLRCAERYRWTLRERNIDLNIVWELRNDIRLQFDEAALDVALSNVLDNAAKYAFFNTKVTVGARHSAGYAEMWVEDIGHGISIEDQDLIYEPGTRFVWDDPLRRIGGTGLGLALTKYILDAHGGDISHSSKQMTAKSGPTTPFLVRFTLRLPSGWRGFDDMPPNPAAPADG